MEVSSSILSDTRIKTKRETNPIRSNQSNPACNPPTDAGRVTMSNRFLRHCKLLLVDFPAKESLLQIYETFNGGILKLFPNLKSMVGNLTNAMVDVYLQNQEKFTVDISPQVGERSF